MDMMTFRILPLCVCVCVCVCECVCVFDCAFVISLLKFASVILEISLICYVSLRKSLESP
jgi:hypothetical protein